MMNASDHQVTTATVVQSRNDAELVNPVMDNAVRSRALHAIAQEQNRPPIPWQRRASVAALTALALLIVLSLLNWVVTGLRHIMDIWYPGSISGQMQQTTPQPALDKPFAITVITEPEITAPRISESGPTKQADAVPTDKAMSSASAAPTGHK